MLWKVILTLTCFNVYVQGQPDDALPSTRWAVTPIKKSGYGFKTENIQISEGRKTPSLLSPSGKNKLQKDMLKEGEHPPPWQLNGENPLEKAKQDKKVVLLALWKSSCAYCQSQAAKLYQWYQLLKEYKNSFKVIVINKIGDHKSLLSIDRVSRKRFDLYQDDSNAKVWELMKGDKDSLFIFNRDGLLTKQFHGDDASMGRKNQKCEDINGNIIIKHLLKEILPLSDDTSSAKCNNKNFIKYKKVIKGILNRNKNKKLKNRKRNGNKKRKEIGGKRKNNKHKNKPNKKRNKKNRKDKQQKKDNKKLLKIKKDNEKKEKNKRKRKEQRQRRKQKLKSKEINKTSERFLGFRKRIYL